MIAAGYRKRVTVLLFLLLLVRFWLGRTFELTPQEAYVWLKGRHLDWGYWDQGPLVPFLSFIGTAMFGQNELGVRWLSAVIYSGAGFFLFYTTRQWFSARAGFYAVILFAVLPLYAWQMLLLSEATASVGLMALALLAYRYVVERGRWDDWAVAGLATAAALTVSWWNVLWPLGLLFFRMIDAQRTGRCFDRRVGLFAALSALGFVPFVAWHVHMGLLPGIETSAAGWLAAKQHLTARAGLGPVSFLRDQALWLGFGCFLGLVVLLVRARDYVFLRRPHLFLFCLGVPGLALQFLASFFRIDNQDAVAALYLPLLSLAASVGTRLTDTDRRWRIAALAVIVVAGVQTLSGIFPGPQARVWLGYAPDHTQRNRAFATEIARLQRDQGGSFLVVDDPLQASILSFYLPLQPFVYIPPATNRVIRNQFDLWPGYADFEVTNALFMSRAATPLPEIKHEFEAVTPLPGVIPIPEAKDWNFFLCERFGATKAADEP